MKYFTFEQIAWALFAFIAYGAASGILYRVFFALIACISYISKIPCALLSHYRVANERLKVMRKDAFYVRENANIKDALDFIFTVLTGIGFIIASYVTLDGIIRLFTAVLFILSFICSYKASFGLEKYLIRALILLLFYFGLLANLLFAPIRIILRCLNALGGSLILLFRRTLKKTLKQKRKLFGEKKEKCSKKGNIIRHLQMHTIDKMH